MSRLRLSDWASIAEIGSALAVVASLLYVGYEIQQNTKVSLASNRQAVATRAQDLALFSANIGINRLILGPEADDVVLTETEVNNLTAYVGALLRSSEEAYLLYRDGLLDEEYWMTRAGVMLTILRSARARQVYFQTRDSGFYTDDFVDWVDEALREKYGG
ncbi:MAG: hypothetical protein V3U67_09505 [Gemmatimonadota bacterium]